MKVGQRGQVTIPKELRLRFGIGPETEVEFRVLKDSIVVVKKPEKRNLRKWKGRRRESLGELGYASVDEFLEDVRGR